MKKSVIAVLMAGTLLLNAGALFASQGPAKELVNDLEIKLLRQDLISQKKQLVAANMQLSEAEALKFWPVYDEYTAETN